MFPAAVASAAVSAFPVLVVMMVAANGGIIMKRAVQQRPHRVVRAAAHAAVQPDPRLRQGLLGAAADSAADQGVRAVCGQEPRQRAVAAAHGVHNFFAGDSAVGHVVELELPAMAEMLENRSVLISSRNLHVASSSVSVFMAQRLPQPRPQRAQ